MNFREYFPYYKRNLFLAFPVILSQLGQVTVSLVDNAMVGRVGTIELAAASFANNVFMIGMIFGMGITFALTPLVGQEFGRGNLRKALHWLKNGMVTFSFMSILMTFAMLGVYFLLPYMGQSPQVLEAARPYYLWLCASLIPFIGFFTCKQFFEGMGNTMIAMYITITANVVNIIGNYIFIYGKFGAPELGLVGAGVGTFISRVYMLIAFLSVILRHNLFRRGFQIAIRQMVKIKEIIEMLKVGIPIAFQLIVEMSAFSIGAIMMGWLGHIPQAAHQVAMGLSSATYMVSLGISTACTIRVSHQMGMRDYAAMRKAAYAAAHMVVVFMSLMGILFVVFKNQLPLFFTKDEQVIQVASQLLIVAALYQVFDGVQVVMLGNLRGMADVKIPMLIAFVAYLGVGIPASWFFAFKTVAGPAGIWYGYLLGLVCAGVLFFARFQKNLKTIDALRE